MRKTDEARTHDQMVLKDILANLLTAVMDYMYTSNLNTKQLEKTSRGIHSLESLNCR